MLVLLFLANRGQAELENIWEDLQTGLTQIYTKKTMAYARYMELYT